MAGPSLLRTAGLAGLRWFLLALALVLLSVPASALIVSVRGDSAIATRSQGDGRQGHGCQRESGTRRGLHEPDGADGRSGYGPDAAKQGSPSSSIPASVGVTMIEQKTGISMLVGRLVSAVSFVMDYVEFHFDGPILRSLSNPTLAFRRNEWTFLAPGSRDALCSIIGTKVEAVEVESQSSILVRFDSGHVITVPLDPGSRVGPEAAHFVSEEGHVMDVW